MNLSLTDFRRTRLTPAASRECWQSLHGAPPPPGVEVHFYGAGGLLLHVTRSHSGRWRCAGEASTFVTIEGAERFLWDRLRHCENA